MGYMESAVVVYLRKIYYPGGFRFPLVPIEASIGMVEVFREAATIIMLLAIGILSFRKASQKFAGFIFCFAIWDLAYYLFLKVLLNWPESFFTPDILFLIPVSWVGPVIAPCIISITMIVLAILILRYAEQGISTRLNRKEWLIFISGSAIVILSFLWDYLVYHTPDSKGGELINNLNTYIPKGFNWWIFIPGLALLVAGILIMRKRFSRLMTLLAECEK